MAVKYWFKTAGLSDNWATAANWYLGSGGTGGVTTVPTAADDVIFNAASTSSSSATVTIAAAATCRSLNMTGFLGILAGSSALNITTNSRPPGDSVCILSSGYTHTGNVTFSGTYDGTTGGGIGYVTFNQNGKFFSTLTLNCNINNSYSSLDIVRVTGTLTVTQGFISGGGSIGDGTIQCANLVSNTAFDRGVAASLLILTGTGALLSITATGFNNYIVVIEATNTAATTKGIAFPDSIGWNSPVYWKGGGRFTMNPGIENIISFYIQTTLGGTVSFNSGDYSYIEFSEGTNVTWDNATLQRITFNSYLPELPLFGMRIISTVMPAPIATTPITFPFVAVDLQHTMDLRGYNYLSGWTVENIAGVRLISSPSISAAINLNNTGALYIAANVSTNGNININNGNLYFEDNYTFTTAGTITLDIGSIDIAPGSSTTTMNIVAAQFVSLGAETRQIGSSSATTANFTLTGGGGVINIWNIVNTFPTVVLNSKINILITDTDPIETTFWGGGLTYESLTFNRGTNTAGIQINHSSTYNTFADIGTEAHTIQFGAGSVNNIGTFNVRGNPGKLISLTTHDGTSTFTLNKIGGGIVSVDYLNISRGTANPNTLTWYAGTHSVNGGTNVGWIFLDPPSSGKKSLALLGVG